MNYLAQVDAIYVDDKNHPVLLGMQGGLAIIKHDTYSNVDYSKELWGELFTTLEQFEKKGFAKTEEVYYMAWDETLSWLEENFSIKIIEI